MTSIFGGDPKPPAGGNPDSNTLISDMTTVICLDDYHRCALCTAPRACVERLLRCAAEKASREHLQAPKRRRTLSSSELARG